VDCAAIPETLLESSLFGHKAGAFTGATAESPGILGYSNGGTVFFDEIGELPLALQPKLLRVLQERSYTPVGAAKAVEVDVRILAATNRDLEEEIHQGRFREDLYYRINVLNLQVPPLRERGDDAIGLARYFFAELSPNYPHVNEISPEVFECLRRYPWPGNVRELRNTIERALATTSHDTIGLADLPLAVRNALFTTSPADLHPGGDTLPPSSLAALGSLENVLHHIQERYLREILTHYKGNIAHAAQHANISRKTFYKLMDDLKLDPEDFRV
jgi:transcriptional regulator with PAS, ATPase and Fis domain